MQSSREQPREIGRVFLNEQCKEIEGNNRIERLEISRKIGDIKETFHARMGMIKDSNSKDLTKAEEIKKRWQETKIPRGEHRQNTL